MRHTGSARAPGALLLGALVLAGCGGQEGAHGDDGAGRFHLRLASYQPPIAAEAVATQEWAEEIEKRTDGRLTVEFFFQEGLLPGPEILQGVSDGRADLGYIADSYYPGELPLTNVAGLPFISSNPEAQGRALIRMYEENADFQAEFENLGVRPLIWAPVGPNAAALKTRIDSLDDVEGLQIRAIGYSARAYQQIGMAPVAISQGEVYESLQRGVIDATSGGSFDILTDRDYEQVAPHFVDLGSGNYATTLNIINLDLWNQLPQDVHEIVEEVSEGYLDRYMEVLMEREEEACEELNDAGGTITVIADDEVTRWADDVGPQVYETWLSNVEAGAGEADGPAFYQAFVTAQQEYEADSDYVPALRRCSVD